MELQCTVLALALANPKIEWLICWTEKKKKFAKKSLEKPDLILKLTFPEIVIILFIVNPKLTSFPVIRFKLA